MSKKVTIIGAGVSGLTTAVQLQERGHTVSVRSRDWPADTPSAVAAAIWFPYAVAPVALANEWSAVSYRVFQSLADTPETGVSMTDFLVLTRPGLDNSWKDQLPEGAVRLAKWEELPPAYEMGYLARVPLIETPLYLPYLLSRFQNNGGQLHKKAVNDIDKLLREDQIVVNCSGLGARQLANDHTVYPIRGQVVKTKRQGRVQSMVDSMESGRLAYIIERRDCIVLGGTDYEHNYNTAADEKDTRLILERCARLEPSLSQSELITATAGLRPKRPAIRCEAEPNRPVIHNYGHGGAGFTVSWGCAKRVAELVEGL